MRNEKKQVRNIGEVTLQGWIDITYKFLKILDEVKSIRHSSTIDENIINYAVSVFKGEKTLDDIKNESEDTIEYS